MHVLFERQHTRDVTEASQVVRRQRRQRLHHTWVSDKREVVPSPSASSSSSSASTTSVSRRHCGPARRVQGVGCLALAMEIWLSPNAHGRGSGIRKVRSRGDACSRPGRAAWKRSGLPHTVLNGQNPHLRVNVVSHQLHPRPLSHIPAGTWQQRQLCT